MNVFVRAFLMRLFLFVTAKEADKDKKKAAK